MSYPPEAPHPTPEDQPAAQPRRSRKLLMAAAALALVLLAGAGVAAWLLTRPDPADAEPFAKAVQCANYGLRVADSGQTMLVDGVGKEDTVGMPITDLACVFNQLDVPIAVREHMVDTRALDGRQEDSWPGFTASWSYHPDDGLDMILRVAA